ncbi:MAG: 50S ribosomal protein L30 [Nitrospirae bacterium]|nr:50S ribosomal protein L30 [Nitrospirota bacterium]MBI4838595.1 50S ribosomal protein L30 [Nitrospirota bacterium]
MKTLKITLKRSLAGQPEKVRKVLMSMGLRRPNQSTIQKDILSVRGQIHKVSHLVEVTEN